MHKEESIASTLNGYCCVLLVFMGGAERRVPSPSPTTHTPSGERCERLCGERVRIGGDAYANGDNNNDCDRGESLYLLSNMLRARHYLRYASQQDGGVAVATSVLAHLV